MTKSNPKWTAKETARELNRSRGSVSDDLMLASWLRTHENKLARLKYNEAIDWCRAKKKELDMEIG